MEGLGVYEVPNATEDKTSSGRAEAWINCYWKAAQGSLIIGLEVFREARRWDAGGRVQVFWCIGQALLLLSQDLCHPRHLSLLTVLLYSSSRGSSKQFLFSFISSELISALADKARHCAPLELSAVKLNYEPWNAGFLQKLVIGTFRCIFHFLFIYSKSDWVVMVQM